VSGRSWPDFEPRGSNGLRFFDTDILFYEFSVGFLNASVFIHHDCPPEVYREGKYHEEPRDYGKDRNLAGIALKAL
jgi:hypothetical protein